MLVKTDQVPQLCLDEEKRALSASFEASSLPVTSGQLWSTFSSLLQFQTPFLGQDAV